MRLRAVPRGAGGFTLVEIVVALMIISVAVLGLATIMMGTSQRHERAVSHGDLTAAAESKFEDLRGAAREETDPAVLEVGGSLTSSVADHSDSLRATHGRWIRRRWTVEAGPAGTLAVTVRALPGSAARNDHSGLDLSSLVYVP